MLGVPRLQKWLLEESRQCQEGARGSQGVPGGAKQEAERLPGVAFGLPGGCQRRLWDLCGRPQGTILEPKMAPNSMILLHFVLTPFFESVEAQFHVCLFCPTLRIYSNLQWNLHVFMFGPFLKNIPNLCTEIMEN